MSLLKTILAIFNFKGQKIEMELSAARIKNGIAYLKPIGQDKMFTVKSEKITVTIDNDDDGVTVTDTNPEVDPENDPQADDQKTNTNNDRTPANPRKRSGTSRRAREEDFFFTKKTFSTGFYETERNEIVTAYKSVGAKRDEYILACIRAASVRNVERELKKIRKERETLQETTTNNSESE